MQDRMQAAFCRGLLRAALAAQVAALAPGETRAQIGGCTPDLSGAFVLELETSLGTIPIELYPELAPATVRNFVRYAATHAWDRALIHRSAPGFVIQGGGYREEAGVYAAIPVFGALQNEACLSNTAGSVAMARVAGQPDSATSQWFVNLVDNTGLDGVDGGFTAFGRVVGNGMQVVAAIAALPRFDTLTTLELPLNRTFRELPLASAPVDPPGGYGCSRASPTFGLRNQANNGYDPDPLRNAAGVFVPILLDPQCSGSGATAPPALPCDEAQGRNVREIDLIAQVGFGPILPMSCAAVAESLESWSARRAGTQAQLQELDVEILAVPEPDAARLRAAGFLALALLARTRARRPRGARSGAAR